MKHASVFVALTLLTTLGAGCTKDVQTPEPRGIPSEPAASSMATFSYQGALPESEIANKRIRIVTAKGDIVIELYPDTAPLAVSNFIYLTKNGYYDGLIFHRVIEDFMIQGGDPTGTGSGGPGYEFADELQDNRSYVRGTVAMANAGPNTNGSQFFIMHKDVPLPHAYTIFGKVISGMEFVDEIALTPTTGSPLDRPLTEQHMLKVTVEDAP